MATTSETFTAGRSPAGQRSNGKGFRRGVVGLIAVVGVSLGLLTGVAIGQDRQAAGAAPPTTGAVVQVSERPADASTTTEYRWDFDLR